MDDVEDDEVVDDEVVDVDDVFVDGEEFFEVVLETDLFLPAFSISLHSLTVSSKSFEDKEIFGSSAFTKQIEQREKIIVTIMDILSDFI